MLGSTFSIAGSNMVLKTIVSEALKIFADKLEGYKDFKGDLASLIRETIKENKKIIVNGNNYSNEWVEEAKRRGLSNLKTTVDALLLFYRLKMNYSLDMTKKLIILSIVA